MYKGIDISVVQKAVDFEWLKGQDISFIIQRCYVGNEYRDINYQTNMQKGKDNGFMMGVYNFVYPLPDAAGHVNRNPIDQANLHFEQVAGLTENVAVDVEWPEPPSPNKPDNWSKWGCSATQINDWVLKYLERYTQLSGRKPLVYTYPSFAKTVKFSQDITQYPLWIASYIPNAPSIPAPFADWVIWQNSGGSLMKLPNGIAVDTDVARDLSWFGVVESMPAVQPTPIITQSELPTPPTSEPVQQQSVTIQSTATQSTSGIESILEIVGTVINALLPLIKKLFHIR